MSFKNTFYALVLSTVVFVSSAFAGKVELTTYYPAPYGEYSELNASKSFIPPRMSTTQRDAITATSNPPLAQGMVIFNTTENRLEVNKDGTATGWVSATGGSVQTTRYFAAAPALTTLASTNNWSDPPLTSITLSVPTATKAMVTYNISGACSAPIDHVVSNIFLDGSVMRGTATIDNPAGAFFGLTASAIADLSAGEHTFLLKYRTPGTTCTAVNTEWGDTSLSVLVLGN